MPLTGNHDRYGLASIILHWLMLFLILGAYAAIELREFFPKGSDPREMLKMWHFMLGLSVLGLVWFRIAARLIWPPPRSAPGAPAWQHLAAKTNHFALYVFMIGMPLGGWLILSAEGKTIPYFGLELPALAGANKMLAERMEEVHELGGTVGYWLIGLHAAASLFHHFIMGDRVLARMMPRLG
jgi:superoxide oxidase